MKDSSISVALITGANKGIGFEIARQLGRVGQRILLGSRDAERGERAAEALRGEGVDVHAMTLDVTNADTIERAAAEIRRTYGKLDILVNNAGAKDSEDGPPSTASIDAVKRVFETNFFGALAVTQAMLPLLRNSERARIVNVSSGLGSLTHNGDPHWEHAAIKRMGYNGSKALLNMLTVQLAAELTGTNIKVNSADPGFTATDFNNYRGTQTIPEGAAAAIHLALLPDDGPSGGFFSCAGREPW